MSDALEQRMTAMRARLSHLSSAVDLKDDERAQDRFMSHRYYHDTPPPSSTSTPTTGGRSIFQTLREQDVNAFANAHNNKTGSPKPAVSFVSSSVAYAPASSTSAKKNGQQVRSVDTMLQLARQHASTTLQTTTPHHDARPTTSGSAASVSVRPPATMQVAPIATKTASPQSLPASAHDASLDFSGLHTYSFQERFPTSRQQKAAAFNTGDTVQYSDDLNSHRYAQDNEFVVGKSANASFTSVSTSSARSATATSEVQFDAFRVVQDRLRQKMRQLTHGAVPTATHSSQEILESYDHSKVEGRRTIQAEEPMPKSAQATTADHRGLYLGDDSPPPRPPPGARAETATPLRSPEMPVDVSPNNTLAPPASARSAASSVQSATQPQRQQQRVQQEVNVPSQPTPIEVELSGAQLMSGERDAPTYRAALYHPEEEEEERPLRQREYMYEAYSPSSNSDASRKTSEDGLPQLPPARPTLSPPEEAHRREVPQAQRATHVTVAAAAPGAFSDPSSAHMGHALRDRNGSVKVRSSPAAQARTTSTSAMARGPSHAGSRRTASRSQSGSGSQKQRHAGSSPCVSRRTASTSPSSPSHPRERSSTGPHTAARAKPISLNVEATILASVSGAELFALLRMRGLIDSEGDTEEYRLPPVRCHRLYVTADEHRQLQLLRQSMHAMEEEAEQAKKGVPSYQRPTVAARSRNAEFAPPPAVTHYMDH